MPLSENQIAELAKKQKWGAVEEVYGPFSFGGEIIWEIWADDGGKNDEYWVTRYIVELDENQLFFDSFNALAVYLNNLYLIATKSSGAIDLTTAARLAELHRKKLTLNVAAFVFTAAVLAMLYVVVAQDATQSIIVVTLMGVIASGAALFFGRWIPIGTKHPIENVSVVVRSGRSRGQKSSKPAST